MTLSLIRRFIVFILFLLIKDVLYSSLPIHFSVFNKPVPLCHKTLFFNLRMHEPLLIPSHFFFIYPTIFLLLTEYLNFIVSLYVILCLIWNYIFMIFKILIMCVDLIGTTQKFKNINENKKKCDEI